MKTYNKSIKKVLMLGLAAWTVSSCQDWLTVYPQTQIVEENFWEDKNDLEGVRYAAYQQMCGTLNSLALWGDLRSDSYSASSAFASANRGKRNTMELYQEIREGRIERDSADTYFDWSEVYRTINYCNKVLQHGEAVLERDKQFTTAEWLQIKAEMTGLRALNYFYLIRAFKDVPYSTKVINNDTEVQYFGATNQLVILDSLIVEVESVAGQARNRFSSQADTKGLITNPALYAMLSDMYLWRASLHEGRGYKENGWIDSVVINNLPSKMGTVVYHTVDGDYQKAIDYADLAMETLVTQNNRNGVGAGGFGTDRVEKLTTGLQNCELIKNRFDNFKSGNVPSLTAFREIYGTKNSEESIFELQFSQSESRKNGVVSTGNWGYGTEVFLSVSDGTLSRIYNGSSDRYRDSRLWFSAWNRLIGNSMTLPGFFCFKWSDEMIIGMPENNECLSLSISAETSGYSNWIIYRLSDVMLQKAEAMVMLGQGAEAMRYVNALHRRWFCNDDKNSTAQPLESVMGADGTKPASNNPSSDNTWGNYINPGMSDAKNNYEVAVLNERQLEFIGEGKRWFDLVRYAERHSYDAGSEKDSPDPRESTEDNIVRNGKTGMERMVNDLMTGEFSNERRKTMINRFKNRYGLYNLIYYKEILASNGKLEQNPVWNRSTYDN